jgi:membrane protease YdiL (CAAX protease family)
VRNAPLLVTFVAGFLMVAFFFIPNHLAQVANTTLLTWATVVYAFALILGSLSLWRSHWRKVADRRPNWPYSIVTLAALFTMTALGTTMGVRVGSPAEHVFNAVNAPLVSTMFALLAFVIASAAFRAFRARSWEATLLLATAVLMMIGRVSIGELIWWRLPGITEWLLDVPNMAAKRAIAIGVGLGAVSTALKLILGIERGYLGKS